MIAKPPDMKNGGRTTNQPSTCGQYDSQSEEEHDVSCQKSGIAQRDCGMTCQQSTIQRPYHQELIISVMIRATTRAKGKTTRQIKKPGKSKNIIKAFNRTLNTTRLEKENLEWFITRFERNYAEVEKLRKTLSPLLLSALLLRHAQPPEVDVQVISMNLESDPRETHNLCH